MKRLKKHSAYLDQFSDPTLDQIKETIKKVSKEKGPLTLSKIEENVYEELLQNGFHKTHRELRPIMWELFQNKFFEFADSKSAKLIVKEENNE